MVKAFAETNPVEALTSTLFGSLLVHVTVSGAAYVTATLAVNCTVFLFKGSYKSRA